MRRAFTLVELLVVIAILAVLVIIAVPATNAMIGRAQSAKCLENLRQLGIALNLYVNDNNQRMPELAAGRASRSEEAVVIDEALAPYLERNKAVFACPSDPGLARRTGTSYYWNVALNGQSLGSLNFLKLFDAKNSIPVLCDKEGWHHGGKSKVNFLYADGHSARELKLTTTP
jgi:prepilin-type N-terminal cleavage/methylation domain-containing protein/prepilin-type processing-associated H-X9-DG protein